MGTGRGGGKAWTHCNPWISFDMAKLHLPREVQLTKIIVLARAGDAPWGIASAACLGAARPVRH